MTSPKADQRPIRLFYSYSHKDKALRKQLEDHLVLLKRHGIIQGWYDRMIGAGQEWKAAIDQHLEDSSIILLLISPSFLASDYCYHVEMKRALEKHETGEGRVIPIILRPVDWSEAPFSKLQALPEDGKPITRWSNRDEGWKDVASGIRKACEELRAKVPVALSSEVTINLPQKHNPSQQKAEQHRLAEETERRWAQEEAERERLAREQVWNKHRKAAEQGDAAVQYNLGWMYAQGLGVAKDEVEAVKWYRKAAEQGHAEAQNNLGRMYARGRGVANGAEAVKWYRKAAKQGHAEAQYNLGVRFDNGLGVAKDEAEAVKWYRKAAEQGDANAQYNLGWRFANGQGVAKDEAEAVKWYRKAAEQGHAEAQEALSDRK